MRIFLIVLFKILEIIAISGTLIGFSALMVWLIEKTKGLLGILVIIVFIIFLAYCLLPFNIQFVDGILKSSHPCPKLSKAFPVIETIDRILCLTAGIEWYHVIEKKTGKKYLIWFGWDYKNKTNLIKVIDNEKREKWENINREEYFERFEDKNKKGLLGYEILGRKK